MFVIFAFWTCYKCHITLILGMNTSLSLEKYIQNSICCFILNDNCILHLFSSWWLLLHFNCMWPTIQKGCLTLYCMLPIRQQSLTQGLKTSMVNCFLAGDSSVCQHGFHDFWQWFCSEDCKNLCFHTLRLHTVHRYQLMCVMKISVTLVYWMYTDEAGSLSLLTMLGW